MAEVVITEFMDEAAVDCLRGHHPVNYDPTLVDRRDELLGMLETARALIVRNRTNVNAELLNQAPVLRCVGRLGVGLDNIDVAACAARGIAVYPATGANDLAVAEYVMSAALILLRRAWHASAEVASGAWPRQALIGRELSGKIMGLIGFGAIARAVAGRAQAFGMAVMAHDPHVPDNDPAWRLARRTDLASLLAEADVVSLHVPLNEATRGMIGPSEIAAMKKKAVLINTARGSIVDEEALAGALRTGTLAGAALDVFAREPLSAADGEKFRGLPNLILTPHIAGVTEESNARVSALIAERVLAHLSATE
jgi:(S)-sulfolactate dehydrogenase